MMTLLAAGAIAMAFTLFGTPLFIRLFKRLAWGQFINIDGPQSHHVKRGTPTMGGIIIILATVLAYFIALLLTNRAVSISALLVLFLMVGLGIVGFIDDFIKTHKKRSLGLGPRAKLFGQILVGVIFAVLAINFPNANGETPASMSISFIRDTRIDFSALLIPGLAIAVFIVWICFMVMASSNGVNLADGLDGLAPGSSILAFSAYIVIGFWQSNQSCLSPTLDPSVAHLCYDVRDPLDLSIVATAIAGALVGFLWWNTNPAKIFLGDTGSLALGGALAALAILSHTELLLILTGGIFVIVTGQVAIQIAYFKATKGKRIWKASPLHHHFEMKGWAEVTIVVRFWIIQGLCVAVAVGLFYLEWILKAG